jgi:hypothetical protein
VVDKGEDRTAEMALELCEKYGFQCLVRSEKCTTMENQVQAIKEMDDGNPEDVIVWVDGDDWLKHNCVLRNLREAYADDTQMTYGSYVSVPFSPTCYPAMPYPESVIETNSYRAYARKGQGILWNHLRTIQYRLFYQLRESDFMGADGMWLRCAPDAAFMFPCLELSQGKHKFIPEVLLCYNSENPRSEWRTTPKQVNEDHGWILSRPVKR